jgi:hypothetical protein
VGLKRVQKEIRGGNICGDISELLREAYEQIQEAESQESVGRRAFLREFKSRILAGQARNEAGLRCCG